MSDYYSVTEPPGGDTGGAMTGPGRVWYAGAVDDSRAARSRFGCALFEFSAEAKCASLYSCFHVRLRPGDAAGFAAACGKLLDGLRYSSPTYFDNGTITPIYDSPEDEVGGNQASRYRSFLERQERGKYDDS